MAMARRKRKAAKRAASPRRATNLAAPRRGTRPAKIFTSPPMKIDFAGPDHRFVRADLEIDGIFHGEASYEGRVFLDNAKADAATAKTLAQGYAGSFYIFGHGGCLGDPGHCEVNEHQREDFDFRNPHPLTPAFKRITVTEALRQVAKSRKQITITIVPVVSAINKLCDPENVFRCSLLRIVTYN
jgi:hypothetical protein